MTIIIDPALTKLQNGQPLLDQTASFSKPDLSSSSSKLDAWLNLENNCNGFRARASNANATYTEFAEEYRPGAKPYNMPLYSVTKNTCQVFRSIHPNKQLEEQYFPTTGIRFPVHPVNLEDSNVPHIADIISNPSTEVTVRPTSSTRTVAVLNPDLPPHCLKPHTNKTITKWRRHMEARKVKHAVAVTRIFEQAKTFKENSNISFYPESLGAVFGGEKRSDWGFIIREMESQPHIQKNIAMVPLCSLYTSDKITCRDPLLVDWIKESGQTPDVYILENIIFPLISGWAKLYVETGVLLEPHGQNVIVEVDQDTNKIIRFAHRDFDCVVNKDIATKNGFDIEDLNEADLFTSAGDDWAPQGCYLSIYFDHSVKVPLDALATLAKEYFRIDPSILKKACSKFLMSKYPQLMTEFFPQNGKGYNYKKVEKSLSVVEDSNISDWRALI